MEYQFYRLRYDDEAIGCEYKQGQRYGKPPSKHDRPIYRPLFSPMALFDQLVDQYQLPVYFGSDTHSKDALSTNGVPKTTLFTISYHLMPAMQ